MLFRFLSTLLVAFFILTIPYTSAFSASFNPLGYIDISGELAVPSEPIVIDLYDTVIDPYELMFLVRSSDDGSTILLVPTLLNRSYPFSVATAISGDGQTVTGDTSANTVDHDVLPYKWTTTNGVTELSTYDLESFGVDQNLSYLSVTDTSHDGQTIIGNTFTSAATRWTPDNGWQSLGTCPDQCLNAAYGISGDGAVIVGAYGNSPFTLPTQFASLFAPTINADTQQFPNMNFSLPSYQAAYWTETEGVVSLGTLDDTSIASAAYATSYDGSVIVGGNVSSTALSDPSSNDMTPSIVLPPFIVSGKFLLGGGETQAFRWTEESGMVGLGDLPGGYNYSVALDVSNGGDVIVGVSAVSQGYEAFRWSEGTGMVGLGRLNNAGDYHSIAIATSGDGSVIVGSSVTVVDGDTHGIFSEAFRWTEESGMVAIADLLSADGIDVSTWTLTSANDVSADGTVIVGDGVNPDGFFEGWLVRLGSGLLTYENLSQSVTSLMPATESVHGLAQEGLTAHLLSSRHAQKTPGAKFGLYASGFGGEWHSSTVGGALGLGWDYSDSLSFGAGIFKNRYLENDLAFDGKYNLDSNGAVIWTRMGKEGVGPQLSLAWLVGESTSEIKRGYLNGSGIDQSIGRPDGRLYGSYIRLEWGVPAGGTLTVTPFSSYSWSKSKIEGYTEERGGFPARFDSRTDSSEVVRLGFNAATYVSKNVEVWCETAYGKRLDEKSAGISGEVIGLMEFSIDGYDLDDEWLEGELGFSWQFSPGASLMMSLGSAFGNDQNPKWHTNTGISFAF